MLKDENYVTIQGWMINRLHLKGAELIVYALIYGFSQDGESAFTGSASYIGEWCGMQRQAAMETLKKLVEKKHITKETISSEKGAFVHYRVSALQTPPVRKAYTPCTESVQAPCTESVQNTLVRDINNKEKEGRVPRPAPFHKPTLEEVQALCKERGSDFSPEKWYDHYESNGWRVGRNPMKDWKAAIRTWENAEAMKKLAIMRPRVEPPCPHCGGRVSDGICRNGECPQYRRTDAASK